MEKIQLNFIHICDSAFLSKEDKINIIGDFDKIYVPKIPGTDKIFYSFFVVTNFTVQEPGEYEQQIMIKSKDEKTIILNIPAKNTVTSPGKIGFIGNFGIVFPSYGEYKLEVQIAGIKNVLPLFIIDPEKK